jgi:hypothetical protein
MDSQARRYLTAIGSGIGALLGLAVKAVNGQPPSHRDSSNWQEPALPTGQSFQWLLCTLVYIQSWNFRIGLLWRLPHQPPGVFLRNATA